MNYRLAPTAKNFKQKLSKIIQKFFKNYYLENFFLINF